MDWGLLGGYFLIFAARIVDVSLGTIRTLMVVRQQRLQAAVIGFFEILIYMMALLQVIGSPEFISCGHFFGHPNSESRINKGFSSARIQFWPKM